MSTKTQTKRKVGVLGATGSVGQRFILLLANHPNFELAKLGASSRSAGKPYKKAVEWKQTSLMPSQAADLVVTECKPEEFADCDVVFSGLDAEYAGAIEKAFVEFGLVVVSNAKNYRRELDVPLVVPTANSDHLDIVAEKVRLAKAKGEKRPGYIVCISNCSTAGLVAPLKPLVDKFGPLEILTTTTMQAISGAGFSPGFPGIDILDNVVPFISGEEEKIEWEAKKILGHLKNDKTTVLNDDSMKVSAQCNRVAVSDGHTECVALKFAKRPAPSVEEVKKCLRDYVCEATQLGCASAPKQAIHVLEEQNRPQPRLDRERDGGFGVSVGRIREDPVLDFKFVVLSHNTIIGAAGSGVLIAELLDAKKLL
ncbi:unnamed protein product [Ambrosiozyma monospora]|uniref:Aspartate-semialdehyde dehydrogenase n=1 Tax=Ambrosiozyma monospora TaxID=43982 RepID=A0A9W6Z3C8_AMBMO|nr:unnamed protein product [Ambrosiozyma monospora]